MRDQSQTLAKTWVGPGQGATKQQFPIRLENKALTFAERNLVPDAHLAALAVEHGLTLCSTDGDFARFRGLRWLNPIPPWG
jgi:hypothetical protein